MTEELSNRLQFLDEASNILISKGEYRKLSSHLRFVRDRLLQYGEWKIPHSKDPLPFICPHCHITFRDTSFTMTVKPSSKPSRKLTKILQKKAKSQHLTEAEKVLLSNFDKSRGKKLGLNCGICQKKTECVLKKQKGDLRVNAASTAHSPGSNFKQGTKKMFNNPSTTSNHSNPHLKKKKKKDQYSGLKVAAVKSVKYQKRKN